MIGLVLLFDALSSVDGVGQPQSWLFPNGTGRSSWFFRNGYPEVEWFWGLCALAVGFIWVTGRVGWWIVRTIIQWWFRQIRKDDPTLRY